MSNKVINNLQKMIDVNIPIIYIHDFDFARVDEMIQQAVGSNNKQIYEWNPGTGVTDFKTRVPKSTKTDLSTFIEQKYLEEPTMGGIPNKVLILREIHDLIDETKNKTLLALFAQRKLYDRNFDSSIIIIDSVRKVPEEITKYVSYLEIEYPNDEEIEQLIKEHVDVNGYSQFNDKDKKELMPSLKGLAAFDIDRMLDMAMSSNGTLSAEDRGMLLQQKKLMVKNSGVIELVDAEERIENIGGMEALKSFLKRKSKIYGRLAEARNRKLDIPKGVFIVGMPGCGKSLCAKATAALFNCPLLKLDMGSMMGKYVGESEANLRKAIKIAEAAAPCIVWIDEIEKAFSGIGGNNDIMTRMFGYFLSWMQDKKSAVYVIATANNAEKLPPELKRKGRFDEIFCVNLPTAAEREAIFTVHLKKKGLPIQSAKTLSADSLTKGFNGADIESVVNEALEESFVNNVPFTEELLIQKAKETVSISKSCKEQIEKMDKEFAKNSFKDASSGKIISGNSR
ncbi:MAG: AAA family ATPase [Muribaculaceae bacterium]|nr:AAA family ATPase [Muribaculaceae bacterium]